jgi:WD40 repeat protein
MRLLIVLMLSIVLAGCGQQEVGIPGAGSVTGEPPPELQPNVQEATVLRFAWIDLGGHLMLLDPDSGASSPVLTKIDPFDAPPAWSDSGSVIAYRSEDGTLMRADLASGTSETIATPASVSAIAISPDGKKLAWVSDGELSVWTGADIKVVEGIERAVAAAWSPDATRLAVGCMGEDEDQDGGVWLVDGVLRATQIVPASDDWGSPQQIRWSPDGQWLAWSRGAGDGWFGDLSRSDGSDLRRDVIGGGPIAWFPDSRAILVSLPIEAGAARTGVYRFEDGSLTPIGPENWDSMAALSPDGAHVAAWGSDGHLLIRDMASEEELWPADLQVKWAAWGRGGRLALVLEEGVWIGNARAEGRVVAEVEGDTAAARWIALPVTLEH